MKIHYMTIFWSIDVIRDDLTWKLNIGGLTELNLCSPGSKSLQHVKHSNKTENIKTYNVDITVASLFLGVHKVTVNIWHCIFSPAKRN